MQPFLLANSFIDDSRVSAHEEEKKQNISLRPSQMPHGNQLLQNVDEMEEMEMDLGNQTFNNESNISGASRQRQQFAR